MFQLLTIFYNVIVPIILIAGLGFVLDRRFHLHTRTLSQIIVYLASPALVFISISRSTLQARELQKLVIFTFLVMLGMAVMSWSIARYLRLAQKETSAFTLSSTLINAGNFGIPFIAFAFGDEGVAQSVIIYAAASIVANTLGIYLASRGSASAKTAFSNIFKVPLPYAVLFGFLVNLGILSTPLPLERGLALLGEAAVPIMLIVLGAQLARVKLESRPDLVAAASAVKIVIAPLLGFLLAKLLTMNEPASSIAIIQTSMPTAVISIVLAEEFGSDPKFVSSVVLVTTLASIVSLTVLLSLLT